MLNKKSFVQLAFEKNILLKNDKADLDWNGRDYTNLVTQSMWIGYKLAILSSRNNPKGKYVIARIEDNRPLFSQKPHVHTRFNKAKEELDRLTELNPDSLFMIYQSILSKRVQVQNVIEENSECEINPLMSNVCSRGTKCCQVDHVNILQTS